MDILLQLFHSKEIEKIIEKCPDVKFVPKENLRNIIKLIADQNCNNNILRYIIMNNPSFLLRDSSEIEELISILKEYGVVDFDLAFTVYPYLLNKSAYEIDNFYIKKHQEGYSNEDISEILEVQGFLIDR